jgi:hypothetical protein
MALMNSISITGHRLAAGLLRGGRHAEAPERCVLLGAVAFAISLGAGVSAIDYAEAARYNGSAAKALPIVELGVPSNKTLPVRIIPSGFVARP